MPQAHQQRKRTQGKVGGGVLPGCQSSPRSTPESANREGSRTVFFPFTKLRIEVTVVLKGVRSGFWPVPSVTSGEVRAVRHNTDFLALHMLFPWLGCLPFPLLPLAPGIKPQLRHFLPGSHPWLFSPFLHAVRIRGSHTNQYSLHSGSDAPSVY